MQFTRRSGPIADPLFEALRRRHPDVDIVLLPPETPEPVAPEPSPPAGDADVDDERARIDREFNLLWQLAGHDVAATTETALTLGPSTGSVEARSRAIAHTPEGFPVLVRLREALEAAGWRVERVAGPVEQLLAALGSDRLRASYAEEAGTLVVELAGPALTVGSERARELIGATGG